MSIIPSNVSCISKNLPKIANTHKNASISNRLKNSFFHSKNRHLKKYHLAENKKVQIKFGAFKGQKTHFNLVKIIKLWHKVRICTFLASQYKTMPRHPVQKLLTHINRLQAWLIIFP
jgi:hypothetical protein